MRLDCQPLVGLINMQVLCEVRLSNIPVCLFACAVDVREDVVWVSAKGAARLPKGEHTCPNDGRTRAVIDARFPKQPVNLVREASQHFRAGD